MDYLPLVLLALVVVGAVVLFPFLRRLKRAAKQTLEASRHLETRLQSFQGRLGGADPAHPDPGPGPAGGDEQARHEDPRS